MRFILQVSKYQVRSSKILLESEDLKESPAYFCHFLTGVSPSSLLLATLESFPFSCKIRKNFSVSVQVMRMMQGPNESCLCHLDVAISVCSLLLSHAKLYIFMSTHPDLVSAYNPPSPKI